jgi:hypothetical protein
MIDFYAANGRYDVVVSKAGYLTVTISDIELDDLLAPSGSNSVGYLPAGAGAVASTVQTKLRESVSVKDFGAVGDGVADDTAAIQAAITAGAGKSVFFPSGKYKITATLNITLSSTVLIGDSAGTGTNGQSGSSIINYGSGDAVYFYNPAATTTPLTGTLHGCGIQNLTITRVTNVSTGSGLKLFNTSNFTLNNVFVAEHYICYDLVDVHSTQFDNFKAYTGNVFTAVAASALLSISPATNYVPPNSIDYGWINYFSNFILTSNFISTNTISVSGGDTVSFLNGYCGGALTNHARIVSDYAAVINSLSFNNVYFDGITPVTGTSTGVSFGANCSVVDAKFVNCTFGQLDTAITVASGAVVTTLVVANNEFHYNRLGSIYFNSVLASGNIVGNYFYGIGMTGANSTAVSIDNANNIQVVGNSFLNLNNGTNFAVKVGTLVTTLNISGNLLNAVNTDFLNLGTITNFALAGNASNNATNTVMGATVGNIANANANVLDWYQEATFTPSMAFGGASVGVTYTGRNGQYTRIGNQVTFSVYINLSSKGSSLGAATVTGLPFTIDSSFPLVVSLRLNDSATIGAGMVNALCTSGTSVLLYGTVAGTSSALTDAAINNASTIQISGTYKTT